MLEEYLLGYLCLDKILGNIESYIMSESIFFCLMLKEILKARLL